MNIKNSYLQGLKDADYENIKIIKEVENILRLREFSDNIFTMQAIEEYADAYDCKNLMFHPYILVNALIDKNTNENTEERKEEFEYKLIQIIYSGIVPEYKEYMHKITNVNVDTMLKNINILKDLKTKNIKNYNLIRSLLNWKTLSNTEDLEEVINELVSNMSKSSFCEAIKNVNCSKLNIDNLNRVAQNFQTRKPEKYKKILNSIVGNISNTDLDLMLSSKRHQLKLYRVLLEEVLCGSTVDLGDKIIAPKLSKMDKKDLKLAINLTEIAGVKREDITKDVIEYIKNNKEQEVIDPLFI